MHHSTNALLNRFHSQVVDCNAVHDGQAHQAKPDGCSRVTRNAPRDEADGCLPAAAELRDLHLRYAFVGQVF